MDEITYIAKYQAKKRNEALAFWKKYPYFTENVKSFYRIWGSDVSNGHVSENELVVMAEQQGAEGFKLEYTKWLSEDKRRVIFEETELNLLYIAKKEEPSSSADRWTFRTLAKELEERGLVDSVSYETVRTWLKKNNVNLKGATHATP